MKKGISLPHCVIPLLYCSEFNVGSCQWLQQIFTYMYTVHVHHSFLGKCTDMPTPRYIYVESVYTYMIVYMC